MPFSASFSIKWGGGGGGGGGGGEGNLKSWHDHVLLNPWARIHKHGLSQIHGTKLCTNILLLHPSYPLLDPYLCRQRIMFILPLFYFIPRTKHLSYGLDLSHVWEFRPSGRVSLSGKRVLCIVMAFRTHMESVSNCTH